VLEAGTLEHSTVPWRCIARDNLVVQTTLSRSTRRDESTPESACGQEELYFIDSTGVVAGGGAQARSKNLSGVTTATLHATWIQRDQEVKAGIEYRDTRLDLDNKWDAVIQSSGVLYSYIAATFKGHVGSRVPSAFLQHSWRPTPRLVVNDGVRWDGQYWISSEGKVAQTILDQWQPRIGVTYEPGRAGTQKVYASFGRFYQDLSTAPLFWYYNKGNTYFSAAYDHDPRSDPSGADTIANASGAIQPRVAGLQGQFFDEFTLGYERQIGPRAKVALRGVQRILRQGIEDGLDLEAGAFALGNPGRGALSAFDPMTRRYSALEASCQGQVGDRTSFLASYVLSRNWGNYEGLFDSRTGTPYPNASGLYDVPDQMLNATGLLPNDHTHVFKLSGSYRTIVGLTMGAVGIVESGMPLSEFGGTPVGPPYYGFIGARGSHGRTPTVWDLGLRFAYEPAFVAKGRVHPRVTLDVLHVASQRRSLRDNEVRFFALDSSGNQIDLNPNYLMPMVFQPPMAVRLGVETGL
jgi:hypothetical protein